MMNIGQMKCINKECWINNAYMKNFGYINV